ncbi:methylmalonyl-CoA mutase subunit beta [Roseibium sp.]|uniref:methylmalonyl-CoA mutase subunit beta n=1 Tax=Roseibium sp. TaxID=1936156 RepID=UPI003A985F85
MTLNVPRDFLSNSEADWNAAVEKALKGAPIERLTRKTEEGLPVAPLYPGRPDVLAQKARAAQAPWTIFQRIDVPDPREANQQILEDLNGGAGGLDLVFGTSHVAQEGQGLKIETLADMEALLDGVFLDLVKIRVDGAYAGPAFLAMLVALIEKKGVDPSSVDVALGADPVATLAFRGRFNVPIDTWWKRGVDGIWALENSGIRSCFFSGDGRIWHQGGAGQSEELACVMASALEILRVLADSNLPADVWTRHLGVTLVAEADQVGTIAKVRAARRIWAAILDACGLEQTPLPVHMQTSFRMLTNVDPWVNLLRNTVATFAAGVGGADSLTVLPHTGSIGLPDGFARRLARNTQSILVEESRLHMVADPSAGSGAIEARTDQMTEQAWALLQEMEADGGILKSLEAGSIQARIRATQSAREKDIATRKRPITGVSEFPSLTEKTVATLSRSSDDIESLREALEVCAPGEGERFNAFKKAFTEGEDIARLLPHAMASEPALVVTPLHCSRLAEPYEALREAANTAVGGMPGIFLACLGSLSQFTARATWTSNAFAAGGISSLGGEAVADLTALVEAFKASGARSACLVSSDAIYAEQAEAAARSLKEVGADHLYLAGKPGDKEAALREAGVDTFIYAGCNLLDLLREAHSRTGVGTVEGVSV